MLIGINWMLAESISKLSFSEIPYLSWTSGQCQHVKRSQELQHLLLERLLELSQKGHKLDRLKKILAIAEEIPIVCHC